MTDSARQRVAGGSIAVLPAGAPSCAELLAEAGRHGIRLSTDPAAADLLLLDLASVTESDWQKLAGSRPRHWIGLGSDETVDVKVRALRAGMNHYFVAPLPVFEVLELLEFSTVIPREDLPLEVLVIDDDMLLGEYHAAVLRSGGMAVRTLLDPTAVWDTLAARLPDVIVIDLHMPLLSGDELAGLLECDQRYAHIPLVFLSGEGDVHRQQEALSLGGADFLVKPVRHQQLIAVVRRHARRSRALAELRGAWTAARHEAEMQRRAIDAHAIVSATDVQGRIIFANDKFCEISGYGIDELIGHNHRQLKSGQHPPEFYDEMWRTISAGKIWSGELCNRRKDGSVYWVQSTIVPFNDEHGLPLRYVSMRTDISEVKRANFELEASRAAADRANQAKTEFLARMSHELRTPMNSILGFAQLLMADRANPLSPGSIENVGQILRAGWHLLELINEVLDLSRIESGMLGSSGEIVDLASVLQDCQGIIAPIAETHGVMLHAEVPALGRICVRADRTRLRQVLINLMSNGIKYNHRGGTLAVSLGIAAGEVAVAVADTGVGLTEAQQLNVFEPFTRFHDTVGVEGTGIGLTITRSLVEMMGGRITVESAPEVGSTFTVFLPLLSGCDEGAQRLPELAAGAAAHSPLTAQVLRVLYVEDNLSNIDLVKRIMLDIPGTELATARSGPEGVEKALTEHPDLILLDIRLPGFDGFAVKEMLAEFNDTLHIPVVAVSAEASLADIEKARRVGIADYITKPFDTVRLRELIEGYRNRKGSQ